MLIRKLFDNNFIQLLAVIIFHSCNSDYEIPATTIIDRIDYQCQEISYSFENAKVEEYKMFTETFSIGNELEDGLWVENSPLIDVVDNSCFESNDEMIYFFYKDSIYTKVPKLMYDENIILGDSLWRFSHIDFKSLAHQLVDSIYIAPASHITVDYYAVGTKLTTDFSLRYINVNSKESHVLEGVWKGIIITHYEKEVR